jgi:hypothetical protein
MRTLVEDMLPMLRGGLIAAAIGVLAATALKVAPADAGVAAAPQQICLPDSRLAELETHSRGWPILTLLPG